MYYIEGLDGADFYRFTKPKKFVPDISSLKRLYVLLTRRRCPVRQIKPYSNFMRSTDKP